MIYELLLAGRENAITSRHLCRMLGIDRRTLTAEIERERRAGCPICASVDCTCPGYFIAESVDEFRRYLRSLENRERELRLTREALLDAARRKGVDVGEA